MYFNINPKEHVAKMANKYYNEITDSVQRTVLYDPTLNIISTGESTNIRIINQDTVSAIWECKPDNKIALLNFASYKNPGGRFLEGSFAQEEALCYESFLYNVLSNPELEEYYRWNNEHKNRALYLNRSLFTPDILFRESKKADVINCACPNRRAAKRYCYVSDEENSKVLRERIRFVLQIATDQKVQSLILGAYGTGVFMQNPEEVARIFKEELKNYKFDEVIFAIPDKKIEIFKKVFR